MKGFTLLELLVVIGILAILASVVIIVLNPAELINSSKDAKRLSELNTLNKTLALYRFDNTLGFGSSSYVYLSIPDSSSNCSSYSGLSNPPSGYTYICKPESEYRKTNGTGWIPVDFSNISAGNPLSSLPVDPVNNEEFHFTYIVSGENNDNWELNAKLKSESKKPLALNEKDGGDDNNRYELGAVLSVVSAGYQATVAAEANLVSYWKMDNNWLDSKSTNNGTAYGGVTFGTAKYGTYSGSFDGTDDYVNMGDPDSLDFTTNITVEAWIKETGVRDPNGVGIVTKHDSGWNGYGLNFTDPNKIIFFVDWGWDGKEASATLVNDGQWHHVVGTYNGTTIRIFVDGVEGTPYSYSNPIPPNPSNFIIGNTDLPGQDFFNGLIDEVAIYNTALSAATISSHYAAGI